MGNVFFEGYNRNGISRRFHFRGLENKVRSMSAVNCIDVVGWN